MKKIAVFVSGNGSNLQALIDNIHMKYGEIAIVVSNKIDAYGLMRARDNGIATLTLDVSQLHWDENLIGLLKEMSIDFIVLAGYLQILSPKFVSAYENKIINIHPSLIPSFCGRGYYGIRVHKEVIDYGAKISGATVHFVDKGADTGPIIMQCCEPVYDDDTPQSLQKRILDIEHQLLCSAVIKLCEDKISVDERKVTVL